MGDPVVFIPPMLCDARVFADQIAELSRDNPVLFAPTCGAGTIEDIAIDILKWAPQEFALAGAGMGAIVALELLRRAPKRITRVAFINANAQSDTPKKAADREPTIIAAQSGRFEDVITEKYAASRFSDQTNLPDLMPLLRDMAQGIGAESYVLQARAVQRRKEYPSDTLPDRPAKYDPASDAVNQALREDLEEAIAELPDKLKKPLVLREYEGMSYQEIADTLDLPINTVRTRILRARRSLRERLESWR